jgi:SHS2 domain-containing protein
VRRICIAVDFFMGDEMTAYRLFDHTADLGIEVFGSTIEELYAGAALALFDLLTNTEALRVTQMRTIAVEGEDSADLLVNFLRELLSAWNGEGFLGRECTIREITPRRLTAFLGGEPFDPARHRIKQEIKAVTYHQPSVRRTAEGWAGRVVFDV